MSALLINSALSVAARASASGPPRCRRTKSQSPSMAQCVADKDAKSNSSAGGISVHRRQLLGVSGLSLAALVAPLEASAAVKLDKYIKRKDLDPLETYVPPLIAAKDQLQRSVELLKSTEDAEPARQMLREGPFSGLRDNIRTVGLYAEKAGVTDSKERISAFFSALQTYDATLFQVVRLEKQELPSDIREQSDAVVKALDRVLETVPEETLARSQAIIDKLNGVGVSGAEDESSATGTTEGTKNLDLLF